MQRHLLYLCGPKLYDEMKRLIYLVVALLSVACTPTSRFHINGHIAGAADTTLYLEHITLGDGIVAVDSARLHADGQFSLSASAPATPELYRLRIGGQGINLAIDSTETVTVEAQMEHLSFGYTVQGSGVCDTIRLLSLKLAELEKAVRHVAERKDLTISEREQEMDTLVARYKQDVKMNFIRYRYASISSYFVCFQMLGAAHLFDPMNDKSDLTWMRAVANAWNERYPGSPRALNLANIVAQGRKNQAKPREIVLDLDHSKVRELGIIDITLPDINGRERTLSDLKGQVVLLDFTNFALEGARERTLLLRELYNKYHSRGLEIYQVSLDRDRNFWAHQSEALPWVCVYCEDGYTSAAINLYQVHALPYYFLIDRQCDLQSRMEQIPDLEKAIEVLL